MEIDGVTYTWTQPVCTDCWVADNSRLVPVAEGEPQMQLEIRRPVRAIDLNAEWEDGLQRCCKCGRWTTSGIYIRINPSTVDYPTPEEEQQ